MKLSAIVPATNAPPTLARCVAAIDRARDDSDEVIVVTEPALAPQALARNDGAKRACGDVLVFVDADVEVHDDALGRLRAAFAADPGLTAVFGSYDDRVATTGAVAAFRNLLHHHVHQRSAGPAVTFWSGLGAIRRDAFLAAGGFDDVRHPNAIEDVELGTRLAAAGARIVLDPRVQGTHLKEWTLGSMVHADLLLRGVPWVRLLLRTRTIPATLNLGWRERSSAALSLALAASLAARRPRGAGAALGAIAVLNLPLYGLVQRRAGTRVAIVGVGLHVVHHLTACASVPAGIAAHLRTRRRGEMTV